MIARAHTEARHAADVADGCAAAGGNLSRRIEELTADDYSEAQQEAWAATADDEEEFGARLSGELTLVATFGGAPVGFASLADNSRIDMLYVHPAAAGQGAGAMLCDALEKLAAARGGKELDVDASDTARGFFEKRGFVAKTRNTDHARRRMACQYHDGEAARRAKGARHETYRNVRSTAIGSII